MKLLIVDDEALTRTGLITSIDWESLGIDEILEADDGVNGLQAARIHRPEIILCDVRMPRMNGISMLEELEKLLPDSIPIFMSGYSDKEYLKAAIRLKTVSYIEKPLDSGEVRSAVQEAVQLYRQKMHSRRGEMLRVREQSSRLALLLSSPGRTNAAEIETLAKELSPDISGGTFFTAVAVKLSHDPEPGVPDTEHIFQCIKNELEKYRLSCICTERRVQYVIYFIFGPSQPSRSQWKDIGAFFLGQYQPYRRFSIAAGETVTGLSHAFRSYNSAVILLQSSFFFPAGSLLSRAVFEENPDILRPRTPSDDPGKEFLKHLTARDPDACRALLDELAAFYERNTNVLPNQAREVYFKLFRCLDEAALSLQIVFSQEGLMDTLDKCFTWQELHARLLERTEQFFASAGDSVQENSTIFLIRDYISRNYMNTNLSVKDISSHVFLSASYLCTFFKNETGCTLNQYLTEFRMEKAKELLSDPRYRISEISARVGYSDGNYFGKSFRKYTGLSPSEYREQIS